MEDVKQQLELLNAEKTALSHSLNEYLNSNQTLKTQLVLAQNQLKVFQEELAFLKKDKEEVKED